MTRKLSLLFFGFTIQLFLQALLFLHIFPNVNSLSTLTLLQFVLLINLLLGILILRTTPNKLTISYSLVLLSLSYMIGLLDSPVSNLHQVSTFIISIFPVVVLHFIILFFYGKHTKKTFFLLFLQLMFSFFRELGRFFPIFSRIQHVFFFGGLLFFFCICGYLYKRENARHSLFTPNQQKYLVISLLSSFLPFIFFSIVPAVFIYQDDIIRRHWPIFLFLCLPLVVAHIIATENFIIHHFWKLDLVKSFSISSLFLVVLFLLLRILLNVPPVELTLTFYFLLLFFFIIYYFLILYSDRKKKEITNDLIEFSEEKHLLTRHLAEIKHIESIKSLLYPALDQEITLEDFDVVYDNNFHQTHLTKWASKDLQLLQKIKSSCSELERNQTSSITFERNSYSFFILNIKINNSFLLVRKDSSFSREEQLSLEKVQPILYELFFSLSQLSHLTIEANKHFYTSFEKNMFLEEINSSEKYQSHIANYLHDEVLQSVLSLRQTAYLEEEPDAIRKTIEQTIYQIETSIRKKMIEWEPSSIPEQSLKNSIKELTQKLASRYNKLIFSVVDIPDSVNALSISFQQFLYRSIRELLTNVYKHTRATRVFISIILDNDTIVVTVEDNGQGFHTTDWKNEDSLHFGLYSIFQQTHALNGSLMITNNKNGGARIEIEFPKETIEKELK